MLLHHPVLMILLLVSFGIISAFIDSTVGGGGLISLPAFLAIGLPPSLALGTNKLASTLSSLTSSLTYLRSGKIQLGFVKYLVPLSFAGSICGAIVVHHVSTSFLRPFIIVLLIVVAIYTLVKRNLGREGTEQPEWRQLLWTACPMALIFGFYDGFFGPGTGSFLMMGFMFMGFNYVGASGNARALNFASNLGALLTFAWLHSIDVLYGLVMGVAMIIGAIAGSRVAIRKGSRYIRPLFIAVTLAMVVDQIWTYLQNLQHPV